MIKSTMSRIDVLVIWALLFTMTSLTIVKKKRARTARVLDGWLIFENSCEIYSPSNGVDSTPGLVLRGSIAGTVFDTIKEKNAMLPIIFIIVLALIIGFLVFAGKKKKQGEDLGEPGR